MSCPLCVEEMDATDMSFLPCTCGYQICLLCFDYIQKQGNKQCPACRSEYNEENFKKKEVNVSSSAARGGESSEDTSGDGGGWERGGGKGKNNSKAVDRGGRGGAAAKGAVFSGFSGRVQVTKKSNWPLHLLVVSAGHFFCTRTRVVCKLC